MGVYDIGDAFAAIEKELLDSMMRNMERHRAEEDDLGIEWSQWQVEQLKYLEQYKKDNAKRYQGQFRSINKQIDGIIREARDTGNMEQEIEILEAIKRGFTGYKKGSETMNAQFFKLNDRKLEALIKAVTDDMEKAETAILRMANDQYRQIIYNAQVYANTGAGTYEKAVDMATKDMLSAGLSCVEYANGARHRLKDYADMAIRTASKRAYLTGEGEKRQEWGIPTVIMNKRGNPCPKCLPWVGKILIDDVWSGGKKDDGSYPLMSTAVAAGLYHPRCRDSHTTYFEGISTPPDRQFTRDEIEEIEQTLQGQAKEQYAERQAEKYERLAKYSLDQDNKKEYALRAREWNNIASKRFNNYESMEKYMKTVYNATIDDDVLGLDIRQVSQTLTEFEAVLEDFPNAKQYFTGINVHNRGMAAFIPNGELVLNSVYYQKLNVALIGTGYHEAGHLLELALIHKNNVNVSSEIIEMHYINGQYAKKIVEKAYGRIVSNKTVLEMKKDISNYALKDDSETVSEAVKDYYMNGYNASILSRQIVKVLKEEL